MHLLAICLALTAASPPADDRALYDRACQQVAAAFDSARGGFVARSHVPSDAAVELGLLRGRQAGSEAWRDQALATIDWSRCLRDTLASPSLPDADMLGAAVRLYLPALHRAGRRLLRRA